MNIYYVEVDFTTFEDGQLTNQYLIEAESSFAACILAKLEIRSVYGAGATFNDAHAVHIPGVTLNEQLKLIHG